MLDPNYARRNLDTRRDFLRQLAAASLAAAGRRSRAGRAATAGAIEQPKATADTCILLWMAGGMAAPDTLGSQALRAVREGSGDRQDRQHVSGHRHGGRQHQAHRGAGEHRPGHGPRRRWSARTSSPTWETSCIRGINITGTPAMCRRKRSPRRTSASWMAKVLGPRNPVIPAFIDVGQRLEGVGEKEELKAFHTAGFFGAEYGPFLLPFPDQAIEAVRPPQGMTPERFERPLSSYYRDLVRRSPAGERASDFQQESMIRSMENAYRLLSSPERTAFDLSLEPKESYDKYNTGRFGQGCLLARRLTEAGARFIEVTTEYIPFVHWDTHESGYTTAKRLKQEIDRPIAQLILDLEAARAAWIARWSIIASEFSRDMLIEGVPGSTARDQAAFAATRSRS